MFGPLCITKCFVFVLDLCLFDSVVSRDVSRSPSLICNEKKPKLATATVTQTCYDLTGTLPVVLLEQTDVRRNHENGHK